MRKGIYISAPSVLTPLGFTMEENLSAIKRGEIGIELHRNPKMLDRPFYASLVDSENLDKSFSELANPDAFTKLEKMMILSLKKTLEMSGSNITPGSALIIATTKGNIDLLEKDAADIDRKELSQLAGVIKDFFKFQKPPVVLSNACVSGLMAVSVGKRLMENDSCNEVFIVSGDIVSAFTLSGFDAFKAYSDKPCKPYSKYRNGITLGEAAASVLISSKGDSVGSAEILGERSCNDANHISGPSRTGEGLFRAINGALEDSELGPEHIDAICAHGTATLYNDEMEAIAFDRAKLTHVPLNSLKGYYGHTTGAAGLLEAIIAIESMNENTLYPSAGMDEAGVSKPLNIISRLESKPIRHLLKTSSGFGGINTAVVFRKNSSK